MDRCRPGGRGESIISAERTTSTILRDRQPGRDRNERPPPLPKQRPPGRISGAERPPTSSLARIPVLRPRLEEPLLRRRVLLSPRRPPRRRLLRLLPLPPLVRSEERARRRREVGRCPLDGNSDSLPKADRTLSITSESASALRCVQELTMTRQHSNDHLGRSETTAVASSDGTERQQPHRTAAVRLAARTASVWMGDAIDEHRSSLLRRSQVRPSSPAPSSSADSRATALKRPPGTTLDFPPLSTKTSLSTSEISDES